MEPKNRYLKIPVFELLQIVSFDHLGPVLEPIQTVLDTSWVALEASGCHLSDLQASAKEPKNRYLKTPVFELFQNVSFDYLGVVLQLSLMVLETSWAAMAADGGLLGTFCYIILFFDIFLNN